MIDTSKGFAIVSTYDATPDEIWTAWTDADAAAQWWFPRGTSTPRETVEIDARVDRRYTYTMVNDAVGNRVVTGGVYLEVVPAERLVFTWGEPNGSPDDTPVAASLIRCSSPTRSDCSSLLRVAVMARSVSTWGAMAASMSCLPVSVSATSVPRPSSGFAARLTSPRACSLFRRWATALVEIIASRARAVGAIR